MARRESDGALLSFATHTLLLTLALVARARALGGGVPGQHTMGVQVHRGVLHDGRTVAVKVQYPGVAKSIDSDLRNLERLVRVLRGMGAGCGLWHQRVAAAGGGLPTTFDRG